MSKEHLYPASSAPVSIIRFRKTLKSAPTTEFSYSRLTTPSQLLMSDF